VESDRNINDKTSRYSVTS